MSGVRKTIVIPAELDKLIRAEAEANRRSVMAETLVLIEEALKARAEKGAA